ncbi:MAG: tyrosine-type recombinase/integrase [Myxococcota bacterium]
MDAFTAAQGDCSPCYRKQMRTALGALAGGLGWDHPVQAITNDHISQFKQQGLTVLAPSTVRSYMLVLRRFFAHLHQEGWIRHNPTLRIKLPNARARKDHVRPEEVGRLLDAFWQVAPDVAPIATTLILGGWRKGEILNLRRENVDLDRGWAYVVEFEGDEFADAWSPKTESSARAVPLHPRVVAALRQVEPVVCPDGRVSPWMFPVTDSRKRERRRDRLGRLQPAYGDRRAPGTNFLGTKLRQALKAASIERKVTIHGLRRTFAVLLQDAGAPDSIILQALGHSQRGVTETNYLPRRDEVVKRWVDRINIDTARRSKLSGEAARRESHLESSQRPPHLAGRICGL